MTADLGTLQRLPGIVGFGNAMELALTGRVFGAEEAKGMGLVSKVFGSKEELDQCVHAIAQGNRIAAPRLWKLNPLDSHRDGVNNKFRGAQFSWVTEDGKQEHHLVAIVGKFSVIWNFQQVKDGSHECYRNQVGLKSCYCYKIVPKDDSIMDSHFMREKFAVSDSPEAPLVVATPMKVSSFSISSSRLSFA